jgi:curved DNA-binding protein CbpA
MVDLPDPIAEGDLERTPFAHVLAHCFNKQITGSVVLWPDDPSQGGGQDRIRVENGLVMAGRLVSRGPVLDRAMLPLFVRARGPYAVYETIDLVGDSGVKQRVDPLTLLATSLRGDCREDAVERVLAQLEGTPLRMRAAADVIKRFAFLPKEERFIEVVRAAPQTPAELIRACELGERFGKRLVYLLVLTKALEPYTAADSRPSMPVPASRSVPSPAAPTPTPAPPSAAAPAGFGEVPPQPDRVSAPPATPSARTSTPGFKPSTAARRLKDAPEPPPEPPKTGLSPDQLAFWKEVVERAKVIETQNYFEMLGVARDAGADTIRKEYFALVKRWHPDRVSGALAPLRPFVERIFGHFTQAHDTLGDDKKRGPYLRTVQEGGGTPEADRKLGAIVAAAMEHQKAEVMIRRRDFEGAVAILRNAIDLNEEEADAYASLAWALFNVPGSKASEILESADKAIQIAPKHDRGHYARGMILRRMGNEAEALEAFRRAAEANPKNLDAVREVRVADMRSSQPSAKKSGSTPRPEGASPDDGGGGFFSKLFGGPKKK